MIVALNYLVPAVVFILMFVAYKLRKVWPLIVAVLFVVVYGAIQPSYMPKGTVKTYTPPPFERVDTPMVDRVLKPKSAEQYDEERQRLMNEIDEKIQKSIERQKAQQ